MGPLWIVCIAVVAQTVVDVTPTFRSKLVCPNYCEHGRYPDSCNCRRNGGSPTNGGHDCHSMRCPAYQSCVMMHGQPHCIPDHIGHIHDHQHEPEIRRCTNYCRDGRYADSCQCKPAFGGATNRCRNRCRFGRVSNSCECKGYNSGGMRGIGTGIGGTRPGIGGTRPGIGGTHPGIGGTRPGIGGTGPGMGWIRPGTRPGTDGIVTGMGWTRPGTGGTRPSTGGTVTGMGWTRPGTGGTRPGTGGTVTGMGWTRPGTGGTRPSTGGTGTGMGWTRQGTGGTRPGTGGTRPATGGTGTGIGGTDTGIGGTDTGLNSIIIPGIGEISVDAVGTGPGGGFTRIEKCHMPMKPEGNCQKKMTRYSYDTLTEKCVSFQGCSRGQRNNFHTLQTCTEACMGRAGRGMGWPRPGTGQTRPGTGGTRPGTGGTRPSTGGTGTGMGWTRPGTGGTRPGTGGTRPGTGGTIPATGGTGTGIGGTDTGIGGTGTGIGGTGTGIGGTGTGIGGTDTGLSSIFIPGIGEISVDAVGSGPGGGYTRIEKCHMPMKPEGNCQKKMTRYSYDTLTEKCVSFQGCSRGQRNNFHTLQTCSEACMGRATRRG